MYCILLWIFILTRDILWNIALALGILPYITISKSQYRHSHIPTDAAVAYAEGTAVAADVNPAAAVEFMFFLLFWEYVIIISFV